MFLLALGENMNDLAQNCSLVFHNSKLSNCIWNNKDFLYN